MLDRFQVFFSILFIFLVISFFFWCLSHAPSKKNKTEKREKMRNWSTVFTAATIATLVGIRMSQPVNGMIAFLLIVAVSIGMRSVIENL